MLNLKGISFLMAFGLGATSMAADPSEFSFPINQLGKIEAQEEVKPETKPEALSKFAAYKTYVTHTAAGLVGTALGLVIGYQVFAGNIPAAGTPGKTPVKNVRGRSKSRRRT